MSNAGTEQRKLAAIMFTDLVGYSALAQRNEALALELLEEHRQLLRLAFSKFQGHEIKTMGDAFLVEFASPVEAIRCAVEIQKTLAERNQGVEPERQICLRIGVHLGDVVHREKDVMGDGVNIAARIEPLAEPGGICLTQQVYDHVHNKLDTPILKLGKRELKNIQVPVNLYRVELSCQGKRQPLADQLKIKLRQKAVLRWAAALFILGFASALYFWSKNPGRLDASSQNVSPKSLATFDRHRLALLPLRPINTDEKSKVFAEGMTEELNTKLWKIGGLTVIAQRSANQFGDKDIATIGRVLSVGTLLEGTVRREENRLRIDLKLIDVATEKQFWVTNYDREYREVLILQTDLAQSVADALSIQLAASEQRALEQKPTDNLEAYGFYLDGRVYLNRGSSNDTDHAIELLQKATKLDTNFALAFTALARAYTWKEKFYEPDKGWDRKALAAVDTALFLKADLPEAYAARGDIFYTPGRKWDATNAVKELRHALQLNRNLPTAHEGLAFVYSHIGLLSNAVIEADKVLAVDPLNNITRSYLGQALEYQGKYPEAFSIFEKETEDFAAWVRGQTLGMCLFYLHKTNEAAAVLEAHLKRPDGTNHPAMTSVQAILHAAAGENEKAEEKIQLTLKGEARMTHFHHALYGIGAACALMKQTERAIGYLERAANDGFLCYPYFENDLNLQNLHGTPEFKAFMKRQELAWERLKTGLAE